MNKRTSLPPAVVVELWNTVAEDTGTLTETLCKFAALILRWRDRERLPDGKEL